MGKKTVLIIEDDERNRKLASDVLIYHGYVIQQAGSAEEGLRLADAAPPDLVLLDIQLPGMSGIEAVRQLRRLPQMEGVPIVAFSASVMPSEVSRIRQAGFDETIQKPIELKTFTATIAHLLAERPS